LHSDYDRLYNNTEDPQIGPSLKSIRTKPKENVENKAHKKENGQAKTPSSASTLLRKITALTSGNTKVTPSHKQSNKYERRESNVSEKSSISSSNYSLMSGSEKYSTSSSKYGMNHGCAQNFRQFFKFLKHAKIGQK